VTTRDDDRCCAAEATGGAADVAIACSLDAGSMAARYDEWAAILSAAVARHRIDGGWAIRFRSDSSFVGRLADLAVREQQCCPFFAFALIVADGWVSFEARAPEAAAGLVDELFGVEPNSPSAPSFSAALDRS
jgi:hypothetical protein